MIRLSRGVGLGAARRVIGSGPGSTGVAPVIFGVTYDDLSPMVGDTLTTLVNVTGSPSPALTYVHQRSADGNTWSTITLGGAPVSGATYVVTPADETFLLRARVTATNSQGSVSANGTASIAVVPVPPPHTIDEIIVSLAASTPTASEGDTISFTIDLSNYTRVNGDTLSFQLTPIGDDEDFVDDFDTDLADFAAAYSGITVDTQTRTVTLTHVPPDTLVFERTLAEDLTTEGSETVGLVISNLSDGTFSGATSVTISVSDTSLTPGDTTAPTITTATTSSLPENQALAVLLEADEPVTWTIVGGTDQAKFEILNNSVLRFASNATKDFEVPDDSNTNNTYVVTLRATDTAGNTTDLTHTVTITDVTETVTDHLPDDWTWVPVTNATLGVVYTSSIITIAGLSEAVALTVSGTGAQYVKNGVAGTAATTISNGDTLAARITAASSNATTRTATITVGDRTETFTVETIAAAGTARWGANALPHEAVSYINESANLFATTSTFASVLASAQAGDVIQLADGTYGALSLTRLTGITIQAANYLGADFSSLTMWVCQGVTLRGLDFGTGQNAITACEHIRLEKCRDGGRNIRRCRDVVVYGHLGGSFGFHHWNDYLEFAYCTFPGPAGNDAGNLTKRNRMVKVQNCVIGGNGAVDATAHPDIIQGNGLDGIGKGDQWDITFIRNYVWSDPNANQGSQGIFLADGHYYYTYIAQNIDIRPSTGLGNGITVAGDGESFIVQNYTQTNLRAEETWATATTTKFLDNAYSGSAEVNSEGSTALFNGNVRISPASAAWTPSIATSKPSNLYALSVASSSLVGKGDGLLLWAKGSTLPATQQVMMMRTRPAITSSRGDYALVGDVVTLDPGDFEGAPAITKVMTVEDYSLNSLGELVPAPTTVHAGVAGTTYTIPNTLSGKLLRLMAVADGGSRKGKVRWDSQVMPIRGSDSTVSAGGYTKSIKSSSTGTTLSITMPPASAIETGDKIYMAIVKANEASAPAVTGWSVVRDASSTGTSLWVYVRSATVSSAESTGGASAVSFTTGAETCSAVSWYVRGGHTFTSAVGTGSGVPAEFRYLEPALTTSANNSVVLTLIGTNSGGGNQWLPPLSVEEAAYNSSGLGLLLTKRTQTLAGATARQMFVAQTSNVEFTRQFCVMAFQPTAAGDVTAPTLSSATGTQTGTSTADLSVSTNEANGTLFWFVSTSATPPSAANLKAGTGATDFGAQVVSATGVQSASADGLAAGTAYRAHFLHTDASGNDSSIVTSGAFTTTSGADVTAPTLSSPTATKTGTSTADLSVTTNEGNGTIYWYVSTSATPPSVTDLKAGTGSADFGTIAVSTTGAKTASADSLASATTYFAHYLHRDSAGNESTISTTSSFTTDTAGGGGGTFTAPVVIGPSGGQSSTTATNTVTLTTQAAIVAGRPLVAIYAHRGANATEPPASLTDSAGNSYTNIAAASGESGGATDSEIAVYWCQNPVAAAIGTTIAITTSTGNWNGSRTFLYQMSGAGGLVTSAANFASGSGTTVTINTGASVPVGGIVFGYLHFLVNNSNTWTQETGWTELFDASNSTSHRGVLAYRLVDSAGVQTYSPDQDGTAVSASYSVSVVALQAT